MARPASLHELSIGAARALYGFVYAPGREADPARLEALFGDSALDADDAFVNQAIRERLGLGDAAEFDPRDPVQRAALLPREALSSLAWRLGLGCGASRLRRLIRRDELAELGDEISEQDWRLVMGQHPSHGSDIAELVQASVEALPETCRRIGWGLLAAACDALPADIGKRLRLKLPLDAAPSEHTLAALPRERFASARAASRKWSAPSSVPWCRP